MSAAAAPPPSAAAAEPAAPPAPAPAPAPSSAPAPAPDSDVPDQASTEVRRSAGPSPPPGPPAIADAVGATPVQASLSDDPATALDADPAAATAATTDAADTAAATDALVKAESGEGGAVKAESEGVTADLGADGGRKVSTRDIQLVQNLIERCLQLYMSQREVVSTLHAQADIEPGFTGLVWQKLEEQNPDFFQAYYTRLKLKDQILLFNHLLDQQVAVVQRMQWSRPMQASASLPTLPQGMAGGPQLLGGPATSVPHGGSDHEGATFSGGSDLRMSLPIPDVAKLDRLNQGPGGTQSAAVASPPLFVGDAGPAGSGGPHGVGGLGTGHTSSENLLGLGGHFAATSPFQFPSTSVDQATTMPHVFSLSDFKFDLGMDEDAALGDSMLNTEGLDGL